MPTPAKLTQDKAAAVALRPETVEFFARVKAFLGQRQESERLYAELCAAAPEAARRLETLSVEGDTERKQTTKTVDELFAQANAVLASSARASRPRRPPAPETSSARSRR